MNNFRYAELHEEVHAQYPNTAFLINTRPDVWKWTISRGLHLVFGAKGLETPEDPVLPRGCRVALFVFWHFHMAGLWSYFQAAHEWDPDPTRTLVFDIKQDTGTTLSLWTKQ